MWYDQTNAFNLVVHEDQRCFIPDRLRVDLAWFQLHGLPVMATFCKRWTCAELLHMAIWWCHIFIISYWTKQRWVDGASGVTVLLERYYEYVTCSQYNVCIYVDRVMKPGNKSWLAEGFRRIIACHWFSNQLMYPFGFLCAGAHRKQMQQ